MRKVEGAARRERWVAAVHDCGREEEHLGGLPQDGDQTEDGLAGEPHADDVPQREDDRDALPHVGS